MKNSFFAAILLLLCLSFTAFQCDDDAPLTQEQELAQLQDFKSEIEAMVNLSICNETTECKFIAFGSKPCGGPWSYLIYSTSIDVSALEAMVQDYNAKEQAYNQRWNVASDCALVQQPSSITCENNTCVAVY
ncbi:hypothetical protein [Aestuariivivens marinum]|uniref:hypothetical protein n=1 Tax=Aestuariivivens marinum TaxID=2913555 RepID=UPI001F58CC58|nr:hypothetical protein [Aestuariivivens marinum]